MDDLNNFLFKYESQAQLSIRQYARRRPMSVSDYHRYNSSMDVYDYESYIDREPMVEMVIPQHRFQELIERDIYYTKLSQQVDYATTVVNQMVEDEVVRKNNPAVEKAWKQYQMLLELCRR